MKTLVPTIALLVLSASLQADSKIPTFTSIQLSIDSEGIGHLTVDSRETDEAHNVDPAQQGKPVKIKVLGDAEANKLDDGRLQIIYDFSKFKDVSELKASFLSKDHQKAFDDQFSIDEEEGVLVLKPNKDHKGDFPLPRFVSTPIDVRVDLLGHSEGMFQLAIRSNSGGLIAAVVLHGEHSPHEEMSTGTVIVYQRSEPKLPLKTVLQVIQGKDERQEYDFKTEVIDEAMTVNLGMGGDLPIAISRLELSAKFRSMFGMAFTESSSGVIVKKVLDGGAADKAGLKDGDVLLKVNGKSVKNLKNAMNLLANCEFGEEAELTISRYGRERTISILPN